jgi:hypothetical protein
MHYHTEKQDINTKPKNWTTVQSSALIHYVNLAYKSTKAVEHTRQETPPKQPI